MFFNLIRLNSAGKPIEVNKAGVQKEKCFGCEWDNGRLMFEEPISVSLIDHNEYVLLVRKTSPEKISILNSASQEITSLTPPSINEKYLNFLYPEIHKSSKKLVGLIFTDWKIDYKATFSMENMSYGDLSIISR